MRFDDIKKINFGDGSDLQIYHDGTDSHITNKVSDLTIQNDADDSDILLKTDIIRDSFGFRIFFRNVKI